MLTQQLDERKNKAKHLETLKRSDWFDANAQKQIANEIRKKNIQTNLEAALEYNPELFGSVQMLYIRCKVNGHRVKAFVDSGKATNRHGRGEYSEYCIQNTRKVFLRFSEHFYLKIFNCIF